MKPALLSIVAFIIAVAAATVPASAQTTSDQTGPASQESSPVVQEPAASKTAVQSDSKCPGEEEEKKHEQDTSSKGEQTNRMFWVVPNFGAVSAGAEFTPMSARCKFVLARKDSTDYSSFVWTGILAGQSLALNSVPELGHGVSGYGRYYWRLYLDGFAGTYFTEALVPVITHEDPRYFTLGRGSFFRRFGYSLSRTVVTRNDAGGDEFNWSEAGGNALSATLSNAYYPSQERGVTRTVENWATQMESAALNNIAKEFWPDIRRYVFRQK